ncbi:MAG: hypothetical protein EAZ91_18975 [Cytophagales bacterium]|nr:MAG: hypothetical protein EAZ91_18975 [Cytophagales bacterium]
MKLPFITKLIVGFALIILALPTWAQVILDNSQTQYLIGRQVSLLKDQHHQFKTLADVQGSIVSQQFIRSQQGVLNEGFTTADYWVRFDLSNRSSQSWLLEIAFGNYSIIDLYAVSKHTGKVIHKRGGDALGRQGREISYHTFVFYLPMSPNEDQTIYIRLSSVFGQVLLPLYIWRQDAFVRSAQVTGLLWGIYYGFLVAIFLYHLTLWFFTRERNYGLISLYLGAYVFYELSRGYCIGVRFLWPGNQWLTNYSVSTFFTATMIGFLWLYSSVLRLNRLGTRLIVVFKGLMSLVLAGWILTLFSISGVSQNFVISAIAFVVALYLLFIAGYSVYRGNRPARYYVAAVVIIILAGIVHTINRAGGLSDTNLLAQHSLNIGSMLQLVLLSVGLANTVRLERREREAKMKAELETAELRGLGEERERLSAEMHDGVGGSVLMLRQAIKQLLKNGDYHQQINKLDQLVLDVYEQVRQVANNLLPAELEQKGMKTALQELTDKLNHISETHFFLLLSGQEDRLTGVIQYQLYLVLVELINNIIKHAQATEASIRFTATATLLTVTIRDNGVGLKTSPNALEGRGWRNIRLRLSRIDGHSFKINHQTEEGLLVQLTIPLPSTSHT